MRSLKHLKLNFSQDQHQGDILSFLIPALKSCTFSLATICIPSFLLDDWILNQSQLKVFEMHDYVMCPIPQDRQFSICKQLSTQNSIPPTIFTVAFDVPLHRIAAFPIFSVNVRWSANDIADSLVWAVHYRRRGSTGLQFQALTTEPKAHDITYFHLVLNSLSEEGTVLDILTSLAEQFLNLKSIIFFVNDSRIHLHPFSFSSLHKFLHLKSIGIKYYSDYIRTGYYSGHSRKLEHTQSHYLALAGSWATNCPKLCEIAFPDGRTAHRVESGHWF